MRARDVRSNRVSHTFEDAGIDKMIPCCSQRCAKDRLARRGPCFSQRHFDRCDWFSRLLIFVTKIILNWLCQPRVVRVTVAVERLLNSNCYTWNWETGASYAKPHAALKHRALLRHSQNDIFSQLIYA